jgi:hypothetical protein
VKSRASLAAAGLVAVFFLQSFLASLGKSPTSDEPPHIAAGLSYLRTRTFYANPQHPPLLKELSGLSLLLAGVRWPDTPETRRLAAGAIDQPEWGIGNQIIATNGPGRVMFWARLPLILVAVLLAVGIYLFGRKIAGEAAALGALALYALDPNLVAHSYLVTTDVGCACFSLWFLFALWSYFERPTLGRRILCGITLGLAMCAKFSAVALIPITAALLAAAVLWPSLRFKRDMAPRERAAAAAVDLVVIAIVAAVMIQVVYFFPHNPLEYIAGMKKVNADHVKDYPAYIGGALIVHARSYFAIAYLLKEPIAGVILAALGAYELIRTKKITRLGKLFIAVPAAVMFAGYTFLADPGGVRYIIPVFPFAHLAGGVGLAFLIRGRSMATRAAAGVLVAWLLLAAVGIYPDHLSYFNEMACLLREPGKVGFDGGSRCGTLWLDDSNVDWGQGLKQLKAWLDAHAPGRNILLGYFGSFPPEVYGIRYRKLDADDFALRTHPSGMVVVSAHIAARIPAKLEQFGISAGSWINDDPPVALIGHALYVYEYPEKGKTDPP